MAEFKIIHDSIYGTMKVEPLELDLMETLEMQRLNGIKQLGLSYLVFPGANHTRIEHSLGTRRSFLGEAREGPFGFCRPVA
jgi:HD superfamily phosphohydrolase